MYDRRSEREVIRPTYIEVLDAPVPRSAASRKDQRLRQHFAPVSLAILLANLAVFTLYNMYYGVLPISLAFWPGQDQFFPQVITHMFAHGSLMHLAGNMLIVYFLGVLVEPIYGSQRYATIYFAAGVAAALVESIMHPSIALIGASGATSALLVLFARHFPMARLYLWFILPIPAWLLAILWLAFNLYASHYLTDVQVAFVAHVAGMVTGLALSLFLLPPRRRRRSWG